MGRVVDSEAHEEARPASSQLLVLAILLSWLAVGDAVASERGGRARPLKSTSRSLSTGLPWEGKLRNGVLLRPSVEIRRLPRLDRSRNFYGTAELVGLLKRSARAVAGRWPASRLTVGELSARHGGWIEGHHSHRNGRDVDLAFYMRNPQGYMAQFWRFVSFDQTNSRRRKSTRLQFDDERNWALVAAMLRDPHARVQYMFASKEIRKRLLMQGRRSGESNTFLRAAAAVLAEPKQGNKHTDHFHVRIFCTREDRPNCHDGIPYWPWYDGTPPGGNFAKLPKIHWRTARTQR